MKRLTCLGIGTCPICQATGKIYTRNPSEIDSAACLKCLDRNHAVTIEEWLTI